MCYDNSFAITAGTVSDYLPNLKYEEHIEFKFYSINAIAHAYPSYPVVIYNNVNYIMRMMEWGLIELFRYQ